MHTGIIEFDLFDVVVSVALSKEFWRLLVFPISTFTDGLNGCADSFSVIFSIPAKITLH